MFFTLYGQFIINCCVLLFMLLQIYKNYTLNKDMRSSHYFLEKMVSALIKNQQECDRDVQQHKKHMATLMVSIGRELDALEAQIDERD